ncbi:PD-(D/E)XK nuclease family protein [Candidatus Woesearchaeota archaeon]|nr:PD-(D/E)XK nuclease family protein [Candidatus Woesearchaeota archaeon]
MEKVFFVLGDSPPHRVQSPSSIQTFNQCQRKYFYSYVEKLPTVPSVATTRGAIAHSVLEHFFDVSLEGVSWENCSSKFKQVVQELLVREWVSHKSEFDSFALLQEEQVALFEETLHMVFGWVDQFVQRLAAQGGDVSSAFRALTPVREVNYQSAKWHARGVIDVIEEFGGKVRVMDYKTSNHTNIDEYRLQLGIYALLYFEKHGRLPDAAGVYFLRANQTHFVNVDDELLERARQEILKIHEHTQSLEKHRYPRHISYLCKWSTGQCDFYDHCRADPD